MFELHVEPADTLLGRGSQPEAEDARQGCLKFYAYFRFPRFPVRETPARDDPESMRALVNRWLGQRQAEIDRWLGRWHRPLKQILAPALLAGLFWLWVQGILGPIAAKDWTLGSDWPWLLSMLTVALLAPYYALPRRPMFRVHVHLLHPEAPYPYPTPRLDRRQNLHVAMRITRPAIRRELYCRRSQLQIFTDRHGKPLPLAKVDAMLPQYCLRILRYAFLSRLPDQPQDETKLRIALRRLDQSEDSTLAFPTTARSGPPVTKPEVPAAEKSATAFRLAIYAHYPQLRLYASLVLGAAAYGSLWQYTNLTKGVAILAGLVWLYFAIRNTSRQVRDLSRWLHESDPNHWPPGFDLHHDGTWRYIPPDRWQQRDDAEVGVSHDRLIAVAVTVLFGLYLTMLQLFYLKQ